MRISVHVCGVLMSNCYVVQDEGTGKTVIIDPGEFDEELREQVDRIGKENIEAILLTHCHFDHVLGAAELKEYTGAPVAIHEEDAKGLNNPLINVMSFFGMKGGRFPKADMILTEGSEIPVGDLTVKVLHTPGHTQGGCCFMCENVMFSGDTLFMCGCGRTDMPGGDRKVLLASLGRLAKLDGDYKVYPGHGEPTDLSYEREHNMHMGLSI